MTGTVTMCENAISDYRENVEREMAKTRRKGWARLVGPCWAILGTLGCLPREHRWFSHCVVQYTLCTNAWGKTRNQSKSNMICTIEDVVVAKC